MTDNNNDAEGFSPERRKELVQVLYDRFIYNMNRHEEIKWTDVQVKLEVDAEKLRSLYNMEKSGGEPDVVGYDRNMNMYIFCDCSAESPKGRRNTCYDRAALESRKRYKPQDTAIDMADAMGIEILTEDRYRELQKFGSFDTKTSSWIKTPDSIRKLGGALFCDRRYDTVFVYHNGAESYYSSRGFRGLIRI